MAYPVDTVVTETGDVETEITVGLPEHQTGDVVFVCVAQDGTGTLTAPGSPWVTLSSGTAGGAIRLIMYAVVSGGQLSDPVVTSSISDGIHSTAVTVRDADTSNPIDAWAYGSATSSTNINSPAVTTTTNDVLMLSFLVVDQVTYARWPVDQLNVLGMSKDGAVTSVTGYRVAKTAGAAPAITGGQAYISDTWMIVYVGVRNKAGGGVPPEIINGPKLLARLYNATPTFTGLTTLTSTIDGSAVIDATSTHTFWEPGSWDPLRGIGGVAVANTPGWHGAHFSIDVTDFTQGLLSFRSAWAWGTTTHASRGWIIVLADASNNWAAYQIVKKSQVRYEEAFTHVYDFPQLTPLDKSATMPNLAAINKIGVAYDRLNVTATNSRYTGMEHLLYWRNTTIVGGSQAAPATSYAMASLLRNSKLLDVFPVQGSGQSLSRVPITLGDGVTPSYLSPNAGASTECRRGGLVQKTVPLSLSITINASASDTVNFDYVSFGSYEKQAFRIAATSSPSASYSFRGTVFSGLEVTWRSGIPCDGANFFGCHQIATDGAVFSDCAFSGSLVAASVLTSNPGNLSVCSFTQGDAGGHAIELTQPGTYSFVGNTFTGYGLDGTTDAAVFNNSGGSITLNVSGGGDTPTVRNGAGASTTIVSGAQVTVVGLATGTRVKVAKVSNGDVLFNDVESAGQISFSTTYIGAVRIEARKASESPYYRPWATQANTISGQTVEVTALQELDE